VRVLFLIDNLFETGGAERFALGLVKHLPRDRVEPWVCSTRVVEPHAAQSLAELGIPHLNLSRRAKWDVHRLAPLAALLRTERFDVLHSHMFGSNLWGSLLGRASRVPVVMAHEHNWSYTGDPLRIWIDGRVIGRLATRFIAVSRANRERMVTIERVPAEKVVVMPTAYVPHAGPSRGDLRTELGLDPDALLIGVAAVLRKEKSLDVLLVAHARIVTRIPHAHLVIAGDGPCRDELEETVDRLDLRANVHFLGSRNDVDSILRHVDVGAMSSDWEGMPLFAFECMATATPLVATAVGGLPEIVEHDVTGLLVAPGDPEALADTLTTVLLDEALRERLSTSAAKRLDRFRIETVAAQFATLYEDLRAEVAR
jgi:glycosyltransferase involved in cell wall biosynthesis